MRIKSFNKEQKILAKHYIDKFLKKYNILAKLTKKGMHGSAEPHDEKKKRHKIKIPSPIDPFRFGIGLHEIGHIILGHCKTKKNEPIDQRPDYIHEYEAEKFAINNLKKIGFYTKKYEIEAIRYVMEHIAKGINDEYYSINSVPKKIIRWTGLNLNTWKRARKIIVLKEQQDVDSKDKIIIQYLMPRKKKFISKLNK